MWNLRRALTAALTASVFSVAAAQAASESSIIKLVASDIPHAAYFGLSFDGGKGVAVGAGGVITVSTDGGATWKKVEKSPTELALLAVTQKGSHAVAVGQSGAVAVLEGSEWKSVDAGTKARLFSIGLNSNGLAVAGGQFGTLLGSTDGGRSWKSIAPDWNSMASADHFGTGEPNVYSAVVDDAGTITIAGEFGFILRSSDEGATWRVIKPIDPKAPTLHAVSIAPAGQGNSYAVGQRGELLISADGGETWGRCTTGTELNFLSVAASSSGQVVVTGMRVMFRSTDGGVTWSSVVEGDTATDWYQTARTEAGSGKILAVGHSGRIIQIGG